MQASKILIEIEQLLSDSSDKEDASKIEGILETIGRYCEVDRVRITLLKRHKHPPADGASMVQHRP